MKTIIAPSGHVHDVPTRELTDGELNHVAEGLAEQGIHVTPVTDVYRVLHLWPGRPLPTTLADQAIRAFAAATDARIFYHDQRPKPQPKCLLCGTGGQLTHQLCGACNRGIASHEVAA